MSAQWGRSSSLRKRIEGFFCYQLASLAALLAPVMTDKAMLKTLLDQFTEDAKS